MCSEAKIARMTPWDPCNVVGWVLTRVLHVILHGDWVFCFSFALHSRLTFRTGVPTRAHNAHSLSPKSREPSRALTVWYTIERNGRLQ